MDSPVASSSSSSSSSSCEAGSGQHPEAALAALKALVDELILSASDEDVARLVALHAVGRTPVCPFPTPAPPATPAQVREFFSGGGEGSCDSLNRIFLRFLRAKLFEPLAALHKLLRYLSWFVESRIGELTRAHVEAELAAAKVLFLGPDAAGRPAVLVRAARHVPGEFAREDTLRLAVAVMITALSMAGTDAESVLVVVDLKGFARVNVDRGLPREVSAYVSRFFPERVAHLVLMNAPLIVKGLWRAIRPLVPQKHLERITFLAQPSEIVSFFSSPRDLPMFFGGEQVTNEAQWLAESNRQILKDDPAIHMWHFCRKYQGEDLPEDEIHALQEAAQERAEYVGEIDSA